MTIVRGLNFEMLPCEHFAAFFTLLLSGGEHSEDEFLSYRLATFFCKKGQIAQISLCDHIGLYMYFFLLLK